MTRYLLSVHTGTAVVREPMTEEEMRRGWEQIGGLEAEMKAANALVFSGRLLEPDGARVVRPSQGRVRTTDGPFAETKEHLGGFYILEARDLDAALIWASRVTLAIDTPIEVRAFTEESGR
jgi:hypothetical protein